MEDFKTVAITDYQIVGSNLARVVISYTGNHNRETLHAGLAEKFEGKVAPVENSFREVKRGVAVGYLRANTEVRVPADVKELKANYRKVGASNIMMDNRDKSLWQVKKGAAGTYLARHAQEDLSELVEASVHRRMDVPSLGSMVAASAARKEFVSFVTESGDVDHGFITAVTAAKDKMKVVSHTTRMEHVVKADNVVGLYHVAIPKRLHARILKAGIDPTDKSQEKEYWTKLYSYDPAFLAEVIKNVDEGTLA